MIDYRRLMSCAAFLSTMLLSACDGGGGGGGGGDGRPDNAITRLEIVHDLLPNARGDAAGVLTVPVGSSRKLEVIGFSENGKSQNVTSMVQWVHDDTTAFSIDSGNVVGKTEMSSPAPVIAKLGNVLSPPVKFRVTAASIDVLMLKSDATHIPAAQPTRLSLVAKYSDGTYIDLSDNANVKWSVFGEAMIDPARLPIVNSVSTGKTVTISAQYSDIDSNPLTLTFYQEDIESIDVVLPAKTMAVNTGQQVRAYVVYKNGSRFDITDDARWAVNNNSIVVVDGKPGFLEAVLAGQSELLVSWRDFVYKTNIYVSEQYHLSLDKLETMIVGGIQQTHVVAIFQNGEQQDVTSYVGWSFSKSDIVSADKGVLLGVSPGTLDVVTTLNDHSSAAQPLRVIPLTMIKMLRVMPELLRLSVNESAQIAASAVIEENGISTTLDVTNQVRWLVTAPQLVRVEGNVLVAQHASDGKAVVINAHMPGYGAAENAINVIVGDATYSTLTIFPSSMELVFGERKQLKALAVEETTGKHIDVSHLVHWSTPPNSLITVDHEGYVFLEKTIDSLAAVSAQPVRAYLPASHINATGSVNVMPAKLMSLAIVGSSGFITAKIPYSFTVMGTFHDGKNRFTRPVSTGLSYRLSHPDALYIKGGFLQFDMLPEQVEKVSVQVRSGAITSELLTLAVVAPRLTTLDIKVAHSTLLKGTSTEVSAWARFENSEQLFDVTKLVVWRSSSPDTVLVNSGVAYGIKEGKSTLFATLNEVTSTGETIAVNASGIVRLEASSQHLSLPEGTSQQVSLYADMTDGSRVNVTGAAEWRSAAPDGVTVFRGLVTARKEGSNYKVTASLDGHAARVAVDVTAAKVHRVTIETLRDTNLNPAQTIPFNSYAHYSNGDVRNVTDKVRWQSSQPTIMQVDLNVPGQFTALRAGNAMLNASFDGISGTPVGVTVIDSIIESIRLSESTVAMALGDIKQLKVIAKLKSLGELDVTDLALWENSAPQVVLHEKGNLVAVGQGSADVRARYQGHYTQVAKVNVSDRTLRALDFPARNAFMTIGMEKPVGLEKVYSDGSRVKIQDVSHLSWQGCDGVVELSGTVMKGVKDGQCQLAAIYAEDQREYRAVMAVTVYGASIQSVLASVDPSALLKGTTATTNVQAVLDNGRLVDISDIVNWSSDAPVIADVLVTDGVPVVKGSQSGVATLQAEYNGVTKSNPVTVQVRDDVVSFTLAPIAELVVGASVPVHAQVRFADGTTQNVERFVQYEVQAPQIAKIIPVNNLYGVSAGHSQITAKLALLDDKAFMASQPFAVTDHTPSRLELSPQYAELPLDTSRSLTVRALLENGSYYDVSSNDVRWHVSHPDAVVMAQNGKITGKREQKNVVVTARVGPLLSNAVNLDVVNDPLVTLRSKGSLSLSLPQQATALLQVEALYESGKTQDVTASGHWTSSQEQVATIQHGVLVTRTSGNTTILFGFGPHSVTFDVAVNDKKLDELVITPPQTTAYLNQPLAFGVLGRYGSESFMLDPSTLRWHSDAEMMVTDGKIIFTGHSGATTMLAAELEGVHSNQVAVTLLDEHVKPESVVVRIARDVLQVGESIDVVAEARFADSSVQQLQSNVVWTVLPGSVASISGGRLYANAEGKVGVMATFNGVSSEPVDVTVGGPLLQMLDVEDKTISLTAGHSHGVRVTGRYVNNQTRDLTDQVEWHSLNESVARIEHGQIRAVQPGTAQVTATYREQGRTYTASVSVTVTEKEITHVQIMPAETLVMNKGSSQPISLWAFYTDNSQQELTSDVVWSVTQQGVVQVDSGQIYAVETGKVTLTAQVGKFRATRDVHVVAGKLRELEVLMDSRSFNFATPSELPEGASKQFVAYGVFTDNSRIDLTHTVQWLSDDKTVLSISKRGVVKGIASGTTNISARITVDGGAIDSKKVALTVISAVITALEIEPLRLRLPVNAEYDLVAKARYSNGSVEDVTGKPGLRFELAGDLGAAELNGNRFVARMANQTVKVSAELNGFKSPDAVIEIVDAKPKSLFLSTDQLSMAQGSTAQVQAFVSFDNGMTLEVSDKVQWRVQDQSIADVKTGRVHASKVGQTTVDATYQGLPKSELIIRVTNEVKALFVRVPATLVVGTAEEILVQALHEDGTRQDVTENVSWEFSSQGIASILSDRAISGVVEGDVRLRATFNGRNSDWVAVSVVAKTLEMITLAESQLSLPVGGMRDLKVIGRYSDGSLADITSQISWSVNPTGVATIDSRKHQLKVEVFSHGPVEFTANEASGLPATGTLTVTEAIATEIKIVPTDIKLVPNVEFALNAVARMDNGELRNVTNEVSWSVANDQIAVVTPQGVLRAKQAGSTTVQAVLSSSGRDVPSLPANVMVDNSTLTSIVAMPGTLVAVPGKEYVLEAHGVYNDNSTQDLSSTVRWVSTPAIADVSITGNKLQVSPTLNQRVQVTAKMAEITSNEIAVSAVPYKLLSLLVAPGVIDMALSSRVQLSATGRYSTDHIEDLTKLVTWKTTGVLSVDNGELSASAPGSGEVWAELDGKQSNKVQVAVRTKEIARVLLLPFYDQLLTEEQERISVVVSYKDGTSDTLMDSSLYELHSGDNNILTFSSDKKYIMSGNKAGSAKIWVELKSGEKSAEYTVAVIERVPQRLIMTPDPLLLARHIPTGFKVSVEYQGKHIKESKGYTGTVVDPSIASFSNNRIMGLQVGSTQIILKDTETSLEVTVPIQVLNPSPATLTISGAAGVKLYPNTAFQLRSKYSSVDMDPLEVTKATVWSSNDSSVNIDKGYVSVSSSAASGSQVRFNARFAGLDASAVTGVVADIADVPSCRVVTPDTGPLCRGDGVGVEINVGTAPAPQFCPNGAVMVGIRVHYTAVDSTANPIYGFNGICQQVSLNQSGRVSLSGDTHTPLIRGAGYSSNMHTKEIRCSADKVISGAGIIPFVGNLNGDLPGQFKLKCRGLSYDRTSSRFILDGSSTETPEWLPSDLGGQKANASWTDDVSTHLITGFRAVTGHNIDHIRFYAVETGRALTP